MLAKIARMFCDVRERKEACLYGSTELLRVRRCVVCWHGVAGYVLRMANGVMYPTKNDLAGVKGTRFLLSHHNLCI